MDKGIMQATLDLPVGISGREKTQDQIRRWAYWKGRRKDVRRYCERCPECIRDHRGARQGRTRYKV